MKGGQTKTGREKERETTKQENSKNSPVHLIQFGNDILLRVSWRETICSISNKFDQHTLIESKQISVQRSPRSSTHADSVLQPRNDDMFDSIDTSIGHTDDFIQNDESSLRERGTPKK